MNLIQKLAPPCWTFLRPSPPATLLLSLTTTFVCLFLSFIHSLILNSIHHGESRLTWCHFGMYAGDSSVRMGYSMRGSDRSVNDKHSTCYVYYYACSGKGNFYHVFIRQDLYLY
jgi:hypothetical protein